MIFNYKVFDYKVFSESSSAILFYKFNEFNKFLRDF